MSIGFGVPRANAQAIISSDVHAVPQRRRLVAEILSLTGASLTASVVAACLEKSSRDDHPAWPRRMAVSSRPTSQRRHGAGHSKGRPPSAAADWTIRAEAGYTLPATVKTTVPTAIAKLPSFRRLIAT